MLDGSFLILSGIIPWHKTLKNLNAITMPSSTTEHRFAHKNFKLMECKLVQETPTDCSAQTFKLSRQLNWIEWRPTSFATVRSVSADIPGSTETFYTPSNAYRHSNWMQSTFPFFSSIAVCIVTLFMNVAEPVYSMNPIHFIQTTGCFVRLRLYGFSNSPPTECQCVTDNIRTVCFHCSRSNACMCPFVKLDCARFSHWNCQNRTLPNSALECFSIAVHVKKFFAFLFTISQMHQWVYRFGRYTQLKWKKKMKDIHRMRTS